MLLSNSFIVFDRLLEYYNYYRMNNNTKNEHLFLCTILFYPLKANHIMIIYQLVCHILKFYFSFVVSINIFKSNVNYS